MPWNPIWPVQNVSVKNNGPTGRENTAYTQTTMNLDHFWAGGTGAGPTQQGHHRWAQMVATNDADKNNDTPAVLAADMDLVLFNRFKTPTEATTAGAQNAEAFARGQNANPLLQQSIMQLLGIKAMALWNNVAGNVAQTLVYSFNAVSVIRQTTGRYEFNFGTLSSSDYLILGGAISGANINTPILFSPSVTTLVGNKTTSKCHFLTFVGSGAGVVATDNIAQGWIICFGG